MVEFDTPHAVAEDFRVVFLWRRTATLDNTVLHGDAYRVQKKDSRRKRRVGIERKVLKY